MTDGTTSTTYFETSVIYMYNSDGNLQYMIFYLNDLNYVVVTYSYLSDGTY